MYPAELLAKKIQLCELFAREKLQGYISFCTFRSQKITWLQPCTHFQANYFTSTIQGYYSLVNFSHKKGTRLCMQPCIYIFRQNFTSTQGYSLNPCTHFQEKFHKYNSKKFTRPYTLQPCELFTQNVTKQPCKVFARKSTQAKAL